MKLSGEILKQLETPCIVVDMEQVKNNIKKIQKIADENNCKLRPHIKTHKSIELACMQIEAGACGITCAKVSEAEVMADGGIDDIFIAYPLIGENKLKRAFTVYSKIKRLILAADSIECAKALSDFAIKENITFEVRLEVDTGAKRTGIQFDNLEHCAKEIKNMTGIIVTGIYTFKSLLYKEIPTTDNTLAGREEGERMYEIAKKLIKLGFDIRDISAGSTPTGESCAKTGLVTEIRSGTYVFYDQMTCIENACKQEEIAAFVYATVVSTPTTSYVVIDAGTKTFSGDVLLNVSPFFYQGFAYVPWNHDLVLDRLNEEHGMLRSIKKNTELYVGDIIELVPTHICTAINLQNYFYAIESDKKAPLSGQSIRKIKVDARGMLY